MILLLDTETAGLPPRNIVYDVAWRLVDRHGNIESEHSYLIREIMTSADHMRGAYYHRKIYSDYIPMLDEQRIRLKPFAEIVELLRADAEKASALSAYNLRFDTGALQATRKALGMNTPILTHRPKLLCVWDFACRYLFRTKKYHKLADENGWRSDAGNVRTTAEHAYRYISGEFDFVEAHTALADVEIETQILTSLFRRKKKIPYDDISPMPWKIAQEI